MIMVEDVFAVIQGERVYQALRWGEPSGDAFVEPYHEVAAYLTYMQHYLDEAKKRATKEMSPVASLHAIRKVAALAVACMEWHGAPSRVEEDGPDSTVANAHAEQA